MKDRVMGRTAGALALALVLAACGRDGQAAEQPREDAAVVIGTESVHMVVSEEIATGPALSGSLAAEREARVNAEIGGVVLGVFAETGQAVRAGQALARIDAAAIRDQVLSGQSAVRSAEQAVSLASRNVERNQTLAAAGAVAERDLET